MNMEFEGRKPNVYTLTRTKKDELPHDNFFAYYAYKAEERKFLTKFPEEQTNVDVQKEPLNAPVPLWKAFNSYICESKMQHREYFISKKQYLAMEFMNEVPEIVCDILFYLSGFVHYRTDRISAETYHQMLRCQI